MKILKDELRFNLEEQINYSDQLRRQIANDLHDSGNYLILEIKTKIKSIAFNYRQGNNILQELVDLDQTVTNLGKKLNDVIEDNDPLEVKEGNLIFAISCLTEKFSSKICTLHFDKLDEQIILPDSICLQAYRILQELITNIIKHNSAKNIYIDILQNEGNVDLVLCYDIFVDSWVEATEKNKSGRGLISIQQRLNLIQGKLEYLPGDGVRQKQIMLSFPNHLIA